MFDVVALGELLIDFTQNGVSGQGNSLFEANPGGAPCNVLAMLAKLGKKTAFIGKVGDDFFGRMLSETIKEVGIDDRNLVYDDKIHTTLALVHTFPDGDRDFSFYRNPGADMMLQKEEVDMELAADTKIFHFGTLSMTHEGVRAATMAAVAEAKQKGALISFDPNLRPPLWKDLAEAKEQLLWGLGQADVVKISEEEVRFLFGLEPEVGAEHICHTFPVKLVFVTCGADGCYFKNSRAAGREPALPGLRIADTTGAGDIFGGSAVWKLLRYGVSPEELGEDELRDIVSFACAAAGLSATRPGGISSIPEYDEVLRVLKQ